MRGDPIERWTILWLTFGWLMISLFLHACSAEKTDLPPERERTGGRAAYVHTRAIVSLGPRPPGSAALSETREYITSQLERHGWYVVPQPFTRTVAAIGKPVTFTNLIARYEGASESQIKILLGAHIDSKFYPDQHFVGADDAASAAGIILEIARQLSKEPEKASRLELVFFDGEEAFGESITPVDGLYGSKYYASHWRKSARKPAAGIILDMVGHRNLSIRYPSDTPPFLENALLSAARNAGAEHRFKKALNPILDDHVPLNNAGIPTLDFIGDFSQFPWWHTEADNLKRISIESLEISLRITSEMITGLLEE